MSSSGPTRSSGPRLGKSSTHPAAVMLDQSILKPIERAIREFGIDFDALIDPLLVESPQAGKRDLPLAGYFLLLERIAQATGDEALGLTERPLLPGALHLALSQVVQAGSLEQAMRNMARSFKLLHGGNYNHVIIRDGCLIYEIDNEGFPYPFELSERDECVLMECILVLMHFLFVCVASERLESLLVRVRTKRTLKRPSAVDNQLSFWSVPVGGKSPRFSLHYDYAAAFLPVVLRHDTMPGPNSIYGLAAEFVIDRYDSFRPVESFTAKVLTLLRRCMLSEHETASALGVSTRTLRRRLVYEQSSFRDVCTHALNERACDLLVNKKAVEEVAEELGYADARSFRRAFLRWNGVTPAAYKKSPKQVK